MNTHARVIYELVGPFLTGSRTKADAHIPVRTGTKNLSVHRNNLPAPAPLFLSLSLSPAVFPPLTIIDRRYLLVKVPPGEKPYIIERVSSYGPRGGQKFRKRECPRDRGGKIITGAEIYGRVSFSVLQRARGTESRVSFHRWPSIPRYKKGNNESREFYTETRPLGQRLLSLARLGRSKMATF